MQAASEHMQNRGLKYLYKRFAQQHWRYAEDLSELAQQAGFALSDHSRLQTSLRRGWNDIRIALVVGRANRQDAAASRSLNAERKLLDRYERVLEGSLREQARQTVEAQQAGLRQTLEWVRRIASADHWSVRLYEESDDAVQAVEALTESGFDENDVEITSVHQIVQYEERDAVKRTRSTVDATLVGGLIGAAIGAIAGALIGYAVPTFVPSVPAGESTLWLSAIVWGAIGLVVGASFGSFFGLLLGRGVSEDDAAIVATTAEWDAYVVSVETNAQNHADAAEILKLRHQREVDTAPA